MNTVPGNRHLRFASRRADMATPACTPMGLARRLARHGPVMLIEALSVEGRAVAVVAAGAALRFVARERTARAYRASGEPVALGAGTDPLDQMLGLVADLRLDGDAVPSMLSCFFGAISYDAVRCFERLPHPPPPPPEPAVPLARAGPGAADHAFFLPERAVRFDVDTGRATAAALAGDADAASRALNALLGELRRRDPPGGGVAGDHAAPALLQASLGREGYRAVVRRGQRYILDGDVFQVVLSTRWDISCREDPFAVYGRLTRLNPSPFHFCLVDGGTALVGASPEPLITASPGRCAIRLLAGTRPRGRTAAADRVLEAELRGSEKEAAEHRMLVDLARNDVGRVCTPATVRVEELMAVERFSHVMHLVSTVVGNPAPTATAAELVRAAFPAGTMTGAPKIRAMQLIDELEPVRRGWYAGAVGYIGGDELQLYLAIRSALLRGGVASLQAGAGIVHDSEPDAEYEECVSKLQAVVAALHPLAEKLP